MQSCDFEHLSAGWAVSIRSVYRTKSGDIVRARARRQEARWAPQAARRPCPWCNVRWIWQSFSGWCIIKITLNLETLNVCKLCQGAGTGRLRCSEKRKTDRIKSEDAFPSCRHPVWQWRWLSSTQAFVQLRVWQWHEFSGKPPSFSLAI